jgi:hypothetical protein
MSYNDWIGTIGVGLVLLAYFLNTMKWVPENGKFFFVLNVIGGALSCYAAGAYRFHAVCYTGSYLDGGFNMGFD